jgi:uncharacterized protein (DUF362 family)
MKKINRRDFIKTVAAGGAAVGLGNIASCSIFTKPQLTPRPASKAVVSVVKIKKLNIVNFKIDYVDYAVRHAIDLLGGMETITAGKEHIMLKPNLVGPVTTDVTKRDVIKALAQLMKEAGKDVSIGEGSAAASPNVRPEDGSLCSTKNIAKLNAIQQIVFDSLGYTDLAQSLDIPLINLHVGEMSTVQVPNGFVFPEIFLHHSLTETDLLCSVPMMKTHSLATVTLGIKNLMGLYPGQVYGTVRSAVHAQAAEVEPSGTASALIDMLRANKLGLVVIDASMAMQGQGPTVDGGGQLLPMNLIIAGTNPLATDMVAAAIMGFQPKEISTFVLAWKAGMGPTSLDDIEIRGESIQDVRRNFAPPILYPWADIGPWGLPCSLQLNLKRKKERNAAMIL